MLQFQSLIHFNLLLLETISSKYYADVLLCVINPGKALVFCAFQYFLKTHVSLKFHYIFSNHSKDMKKISVNISYFHQFSLSFRSFGHSPVSKKLMISLITDGVSLF